MHTSLYCPSVPYQMINQQMGGHWLNYWQKHTAPSTSFDFLWPTIVCHFFSFYSVASVHCLHSFPPFLELLHINPKVLWFVLNGSNNGKIEMKQRVFISKYYSIPMWSSVYLATWSSWILLKTLPLLSIQTVLYVVINHRYKLYSVTIVCHRGVTTVLS